MKLKGSKRGNVIIIDDVSRVPISSILSNLSASQRLTLMLRKYVKIGLIQKKNYVTELNGYLLECSEHGYQITYPSGYNHELKCPACIKQQQDYCEVSGENNQSNDHMNKGGA